MSDNVLVLNTGSSSIKFGVYATHGARLGPRQLGGQIAGIGAHARLSARDASGAAVAHEQPVGTATQCTQAEALAYLIEWLGEHADGSTIAAAGHRVVHGSAWYSTPVRIDDTVIERLRSLVPIARLHQPFEIDAIVAMRERDPRLMQVACFDTAFHRDQPPLAQLYALPRALIDRGVRRYGFHGLSYEYIASRLPALIDRADTARVVVAHLGSGSSMCAMRGGHSVATSMGFTALEGLMMGTRAGSIDPGIVLYLLEECGMSAREVSDLLYRQSGLLGVSGISADMRILLASESPHAREAVDLYAYLVVREAGALIACLGGIDALVFTAGIGERAAPVREKVCNALAWLGIELDPRANAADAERISRDSSPIAVYVVPTDEESVIARAVAAMLAEDRMPRG